MYYLHTGQTICTQDKNRRFLYYLHTGQTHEILVLSAHRTKQEILVLSAHRTKTRDSCTICTQDKHMRFLYYLHTGQKHEMLVLSAHRTKQEILVLSAHRTNTGDSCTICTQDKHWRFLYYLHTEQTLEILVLPTQRTKPFLRHHGLQGRKAELINTEEQLQRSYTYNTCKKTQTTPKLYDCKFTAQDRSRHLEVYYLLHLWSKFHHFLSMAFQFQDLFTQALTDTGEKMAEKLMFSAADYNSLPLLHKGQQCSVHVPLLHKGQQCSVHVPLLHKGRQCSVHVPLLHKGQQCSI